MRPVTQVAVFRGLGVAHRLGVPVTETVSRANKIDWRSDAPHWQDVIICTNGHMINKRDAAGPTGRVIGYMIANDVMPERTVNALRAEVSTASGGGTSLPTPVA